MTSMGKIIKKWYNDPKNPKWYHNDELVAKAVKANNITPQDYEAITGKPYEE